MSDYEISRRLVRNFRLRYPNYPTAAAMEDLVMAAIREARVQPVGLDPVQPEGKPAGPASVAELMATQEGMGQS